MKSDAVTVERKTLAETATKTAALASNSLTDRYPWRETI